MSNGGPVGSRAPYIIICNGRIDLRAARDSMGRIQAASHCATALVTYYGERLNNQNTEPISTLQHEMMDLVEGKGTPRTRPDEMVSEMFALLDDLEDEMEAKA